MAALLEVTFSGHKKVKRVFWGVLLGRGYLGPLREKGETRAAQVAPVSKFLHFAPMVGKVAPEAQVAQNRANG